MKHLSLLLSAVIISVSSLFAQSCTEIVAVMNTQIWASEISWNVINDDGEIVYSGLNNYSNNQVSTEILCLVDGCYNVQMFDSFGDGWNGASLDLLLNGAVQTYHLISGEYNVLPLNVNSTDSCGIGSLIWGCTDPNALNCDAFANVDDGSWT